MTILAWLAVTITVGTWVGIRLAEENQRMHHLIEMVLATPIPQSGYMHRYPAGKAFDRHAAEALAIVAADRAPVIDIRSREVIA